MRHILEIYAYGDRVRAWQKANGDTRDYDGPDYDLACKVEDEYDAWAEAEYKKIKEEEEDNEPSYTLEDLLDDRFEMTRQWEINW